MNTWPTTADMGTLFRRVVSIAWVMLSAKMLYCVVFDVAVQGHLLMAFIITTIVMLTVWFTELEFG